MNKSSIEPLSYYSSNFAHRILWALQFYGALPLEFYGALALEFLGMGRVGGLNCMRC